MPHKNRGNRKRRQCKTHKQPPKVNRRHKQQRKVNGGPEAVAYKRIFKLLQLYDKWNISRDNSNIYALVYKHYKSEDINLFLKDYDYIMNNIDTHKKYLNYYNKCDENKCIIFRRNYRNTSKLSQDNKRRTSLYNGINDEIQVSIMQHIDIIHNIFYHLIHSGLRYYNSNNKHTLKIRKQNILSKRSEIAINNNHKFITHCEEIKENDKYPKYSQGFRYYYHERYKHINEQIEQIPGTDIIDHGNVGDCCGISDYYILPKYSDLKTEILSNKNFNFSTNQWCNLNIKAKWKHNTYKHSINRANDTWQKVYGYHSKTIIGLECILCLLLYTNYDFIATKLTQTYRKSTPDENDATLKNRHSYFVHLGKGLKETIEVFGVPLWRSRHKEFYHGITQKMVFDGLAGNFCSPTSTSIIKDVAINFGGDGIILTIRTTKADVNYFNCISFSDFPGEAEMLFIGGLHPLQIIGLSDLCLCKNYNEYIYVIKILQYCLEGMPSLDVLSDERYDILLNLLSINLQLSKSNKSILVIPLYIQKIFHHILISFDCITIDIALFKKELVYTNEHVGAHYGYNKLFPLFIDENKFIRFQTLYKLVPQIRDIKFRCVKWSSNCESKYKSSIKITDDILLNIFSVLQYWPLNGGIFIKSPLNSLSSLKALAKKYTETFVPLGYDLEVAECKDLLCGSCNSFNIRRFELVETGISFAVN